MATERLTTPDRGLQQLREVVEKRTGKTPEELYSEREKRVGDAIELREPDRVPFWLQGDPAERAGIPRAAAYYDPAAWRQAVIQVALDFQPDMAHAGFGTSGLSWEALDVKNKLWPGGPLPPDYEYQFVEGEYMKEDEYDLLLSDPSDFVVRRYLPRVYGALMPLAKFPPLSSMMSGFEALTTWFCSPEFEKFGQALRKAGQASEAYRREFGNLQEDLALLGFPAYSHPGSGIPGAPFDVVSSALRGMKGSMTDMYRQPENLLQACDLVLDMRIANGVRADPKKRGNPKKAAMPLWRGDKAFMSDKQFERFYWPGLKRAMLAAIDLGYVAMPFFEAEFGDRLERLLELPRGKFIATVQHMDVFRAKEILGGHCCIQTSAPSSMRLGSLQELEEYYKKLIKVCGKGGGFILNVGFPKKAPKEAVNGMLDSLREYGRY